MGFIGKAIERRGSWITGGSLENPANWGLRMFGAVPSAAGVDVTERNAMYMVDVLTAVSKISQTIAMLPLPVYKRLENGGKERAVNHPLYRVLQEQANDEMTAYVFKETLSGHIETWGNGYAWIERDGNLDVHGLWPLLPDRTWPYRRNGELWYYSRVKKLPTDPGEERHFPAKDVFHVPGFGFDGLLGYSPIQMLRESIGLAMAQDEYSSRMFSNGATPPMVLKVPRGLSPEDRERIKVSWNEGHQGASKAWRMAVLEEGMEVQTIGINPLDAQMLEGQKYSRARIMGFFGVPPSITGDTDRATSWGTGIEQQTIGFVQTAIQPRASRFEQQVDMKLLMRERDKNYFAEFLLDALVRGDTKTRYESYAQGFGKWLTADDIREKENMNPYVKPADPKDVGKVLVWQTSMAPAEKIVDGTANPAPVAPTPPDDTPPEDQKPDEKKSVRTDVVGPRRSLMEAQRHAFTAVADEIMKREQRDVLAALKKKNRREAVDAVYGKHETYIREKVLPLLQTYAGVIASDVTREIGRTVAVPDSFVAKYAQSYARRHTAVSLEEVRQIEDDGETAVAAWSSRPAWIAERESIQAGNAFARAAYREAGVNIVRWSAGDECVLCLALDGETAGVDGAFVTREEAPDNAFVPANGLKNPPLCDGCSCVVVGGDDVVIAPAPEAARSGDRLMVALLAQKREVVAPAPAPITNVYLTVPDRPLTVENIVNVPPGVTNNHIDARTNVEKGAIQSSTPLTLEKGAIQTSTPVTIEKGAVQVESASQTGVDLEYDNQGRVVGTKPKRR
jgi:HK97 family phage portal protein